ncbi:MAG TPA: hypothetical protein VNI02_17500 [Blastocatellia bacterium]|jgi:hypothetical protein|nr:hypothetical protein [Blastocatellia bacterium]
MPKRKDEQIANGYTTLDEIVYRFEHVKNARADEMRLASESPFIVETIVTVAGHDDPDSVHLNQYMLDCLGDAIEFAQWVGDVEPAVNIRPASDEEIEAYRLAARKLKRSKSEAIPDGE